MSNLVLFYLCKAILDAAMVAIGIENKLTRIVWNIDLRKNYGVPISVAHYGMTNLFADLSADLEAFFAVMRCVSVVYPHHAKRVFTRKLLVIVCFSLLIILIPKNMFYGFAHNPPLKKTVWQTVSVWVNFLCRTSIPAPIVFICTVRIVVTLCESEKRRSKMIVSRSLSNMQSSSSNRLISRGRSLTKIIVFMSLSMLFTYVPYWVLDFFSNSNKF